MDDEVTALLSIRSEESIQQKLLGTVTNVVSFRHIAQELERKDFIMILSNVGIKQKH